MPTLERKRALVRSILLFLLLPAPFVHAQTAPGAFADNNNPSGAPDPEKLSQIWNIDPITGSLSIRIPFTTTPQGGRGPTIPFALIYNSSSTLTLQTQGTTIEGAQGITLDCLRDMADIAGCEVASSSAPIQIPSNPTILEQLAWVGGNQVVPHGPTGPWVTTGPYLLNSSSTVATQPVSPYTGNTLSGCTIDGPYLFTDEMGATHDLNLISVENVPIIPNGTVPSGYSTPCSEAIANQNLYTSTSRTTDGTGMQTTFTSAIYPDGTVFTPPNTLEDSNGNISTLSQDSLGRQAFSTTLPLGAAGQIPANSATNPFYTVTTTNAVGVSQIYKVTVGAAAFATQQKVTMPHPTEAEISNQGYCAINCPNQHSIEQVTQGTTTNVITSIQLPDGNSYSFTYDPNYATISAITFPTGGSVNFTWGVRNDGGGYGAYSRLSTLVVTQAVLSTGTGTPMTWTYCYLPSASTTPSSTNCLLGSPNTGVTRITAPDSSYSLYQNAQGFIYSEVFQMGAAPSWKAGLVANYSGGGNLIKTEATNYINNPQSSANGLPWQVATTYYDSSPAQQKQVQFVYDAYANVTAKYESTFYPCSGSCATPQVWLRQTFTNYLWSSPNACQTSGGLNYAAAHIVDKPSQVLVTDGQGYPYSLVQYCYDETTPGGSNGYVNHDDANFGFGAPARPRGNLTTEQHCASFSNSSPVTPSTAASACSSWLKTTHTYDVAGQVLTTTDPNSITTKMSYADTYATSPGSIVTDGYVTQVTVPYPGGYIDSYNYYYSSGQVHSHIDWNNQVTNYFYADTGNMGRLSEIEYPGYPNGQDLTIGYTDTPLEISTTSNTTSGQTQGKTIRTTSYDGLGRIIGTELVSDPSETDNSAADYTATTYDNMGRVYQVWNPSRCNPTTSASCPGEGTWGVTTYAYDGIGRKTSAVDSDGVGTQTWTYAGNSVTYTNENKYQWTRFSDGLGRLTAVREPDPRNASGTMETDYAYDPLGNLTLVTQNGGAGSTGVVIRSFSYDGASRLLQAYNPESGWVCYGTTGGVAANGTNCTSGYDGDGNPLFKTDARGITINYKYDNLNHLLAKTFSNDPNGTPSSCYQFGLPSAANGTAGRLINAWTQSASAGLCPSSLPGTYSTARQIIQYDPMGRIVNEQQCTPSNCTSSTPYSLAYTYDYTGNVISAQNGVTNTPTIGTIDFSYGFDGAGRLTQVSSTWATDSAHPRVLFSATAVPSGTSLPCAGAQTYPYAAFGGLWNATFGNGLTLNRAYDNRLRTNCENGVGSTVTGGTPGNATIIVIGAEQSK